MNSEKLTGLGFSEEFSRELLSEMDEETYSILTDPERCEVYGDSIRALRELGFGEDMIIELWCDCEAAFTIGADVLRRRLGELIEAVGEYWLDVLNEEFEDYDESRCFGLLAQNPTDKQWSKYLSQL